MTCSAGPDPTTTAPGTTAPSVRESAPAGENSPNWSACQAVLLDLDGVLRQGNRLLPGATEALARLRAAGKAIRIVSNNSLMGRAEFAATLDRLGLSVEPRELVMATELLAQRLAKEMPRATAYVIGTPALVRELTQVGLRVLAEPEEIDYLCDVLVVGGDPDISYLKLTRALRVLLRGARFAVPSVDGIYPSETGPLPGSGAMVGAVSGMVKREPDLLVGKPRPDLLLAAAASCGVEPSQAVMVGDTLATDIAAARAAGCPSILVLTGNSRAEDVRRSPHRPDAMATDLMEVLALLGV